MKFKTIRGVLGWYVQVRFSTFEGFNRFFNVVEDDYDEEEE
jgi:hypothetical protein